MNNKLIVVTGKSGIGKTLILTRLKIKNTIYLDDVIKNQMYVKGHPAFNQITSWLGNSIVKNNKIDTSILGNIVLNDKSKFKKLNSIILPFIQEYLVWLKAQGSFVVEMASYINYEDKFKDLFDYVILVTRKTFNLDKKFNYLDKKVQLIQEKEIEFDTLIDLEDNRSFDLMKKTILKVIS